jgi:hypothetical protein
MMEFKYVLSKYCNSSTNLMTKSLTNGFRSVVFNFRDSGLCMNMLQSRILLHLKLHKILSHQYIYIYILFHLM